MHHNLKAKTIQINNQKFPYLVGGNELGPNLVLVHGWNSDALDWVSFFPLLLPKYHLFVLNLPGFGYSPEIKDYSVVGYSRWLLVALNELDLTHHVNLIGHSFGGDVVLKAVLMDQKRFSRIIFVNPGIFSSDQIKIGLKATKEVLLRLYQHREKVYNYIKGSFWNSDLQKFFSKYFTAAQVEKGPGSTETAFLETLFDILKFDFLAEYKKLTVCHCFVFGHKDEFWQNLIPETQKLLEPRSFVLVGNHLLSSLDATLFYRIVKSFIKRVPFWQRITTGLQTLLHSQNAGQMLPTKVG